MPDMSNITPERYGMAGEDVRITTKDGVSIHAWLLKLKQWTAEELRSRPVILFFQVSCNRLKARYSYYSMHGMLQDHA